MANVIDVLKQRGFIDQTTHDRELTEYIEQGNITCYIGFDPTASSLHIGSLVPIMSLAHMQRHGHRPIALIGGGTGLIGDPSGKTEMRKMLTRENIEENALGLKKQLSNFLDFRNGKALDAQQRRLADEIGIYFLFTGHRPTLFGQPHDQSRKLQAAIGFRGRIELYRIQLHGVAGI